MEAKHIKRTLAQYVSLNVMGTIAFSCYILADTVFIARGIGANGLTALNISLPVFSFIMGIGLMIGMGGATRFAISGSRTVFTQSLFYLLFASIPLLLLGAFFHHPLAALLGADATIVEDAGIYLQVILLFSPAFMLNSLMQCYIRNDRRPTLVMVAMIAGSFSNIVLDYVLIYPCRMGLLGAALATGSAPVVGLLIQSVHFIKKHHSFGWVRCLPSMKVMKDISALGVFALITECSSGVVILVYNKVILQLTGNIGVAAYSIVANIALVVMSVYIGISQGVQPVASKLYRNNDRQGLRLVRRYTFRLSVFFALGIFGCAALFASPVVALFNPQGDPILAKLGHDGMHYYFSAFLFAGINILASALLSAQDKPKPAFLISLLRGFVVIIPMVVLLSQWLGMTGVWMAMTCSELLVSFCAMACMLHNK